MKDATEDVKGWKEMKEDREELVNKAKEITKPNSKTIERKKKTKECKKGVKNKKQEWSNVELDNKNENRRIVRNT